MWVRLRPWVFGIGKQGGGAMGQRQTFGLPGLEAGRAQQLQQLALAQARVKLPVRAGRQRAADGALCLTANKACSKRSVTPAL
jgi:hypothetical protein